MPEIRLTDDQLERLEDVCDAIETAYVGPYGRVTPADAVDYLLDTYSPPSDHEAGNGAAAPDTDADPSSDGPGANGATNGDGDAKNGSEQAKTKASTKPSDGGSPLAAAAALLDDNDDVWRESDGDAPYEVDLPDGSTEGVRTKDDVKRLLFKHYR
jgi:hypothetical protein